MDSSNSILDIPNYRILLHPELGGGTFGTVYNGIHKTTKEKVAVKKILFKEGDERIEERVTMAYKEIKTNERLRSHRNIIQFLNHYVDQHAFWIVMEYCELGDLDHYLKKHCPGLSTKVDIMYQCCSAIVHMHSLKPPIIHRDIKTKNFLLTREGGKDLVKVTDFGLVKLWEISGNKTEELSVYMETVGGTMDYMAPEFWQSYVKYKASVDTFSLGLVLMVVLQYENGLPDKYLKPLSVKMRSAGGPTVCVGMEMNSAKMNNQVMPEVVEILAKDCPTTKSIKEIIKKMVVYDHASRMPMTEVKEEIARLLDDVAERPRAESVCELPAIQSSHSEGGSGEEDQAGYVLLNGLIKAFGGLKTIDLPMSSQSFSKISHRKDSGGFQRYDVVTLSADSSQIQSLQSGHGGWNPEMLQCCKVRGIVTGATPSGVRVTFINGHSFILNPNTLALLNMSQENIEAGDIVVIKHERDFVESMQGTQGSGGWIEDMAQVLGKPGLVRCVKDNRVKVEHQDLQKSYIWHIVTLVLVAKGDDVLSDLLSKTQS